MSIGIGSSWDDEDDIEPPVVHYRYDAGNGKGVSACNIRDDGYGGLHWTAYRDCVTCMSCRDVLFGKRKEEPDANSQLSQQDLDSLLVISRK